MGIMDFLTSERAQNAIGGLGHTLMALDQGQMPNLQPYHDRMAQMQRQEKLRGLSEQLMGSGALGLTPQQRGLLGPIMEAMPEAGMGVLMNKAFPAPSDPYARYKNVDGALWDVGANGGPQQLSKPEVGGSRYYTVNTSRGVMLVDKHNGQSQPLGSVGGGQSGASPTAGPYLPPSADPALQGEIAAAKEGAKTGVENAAAAPAEIDAAQNTLRVLQDFGAHPGFNSLYGGRGPFDLIPNDSLMNIPGGDAANANAYLKQIEGKSFIQAFQDLKGGGHITEIEGQKATAAMSRLLDTRQSPEAARQALTELQEIIGKGLERARQKGTGAPARAAPQTPRGPISEMSLEELQEMKRRKLAQ